MKKNLYFILASFIILANIKTKAQFNLTWAKGLGSANSEKVLSTVADNSGNTISTGYFQGTVDFDPGALVFNLTSAGKDDIFVLKLDKNGNFIWARRMGGSAFERGNGVAVDATDDIFVCGYFESTCDFDPVGTNTTLTSAGLQDAYIVKIDNAGTFQWVHQMGGPDPDFAYGIAVDINNAVAAVGSFETTCDFDYPAGTTITVNAKKDAYICKVDGSGVFQWAREVGSPENEEAYSASIDSNGDFYVTGYFEDVCFFDPTAANINLISAGDKDIFIFRSDNNSGKFIWAIQMGDVKADVGNGIHVDANNDVFITGQFDGLCNFDPTNTNFSLTSLGLTDAFVAKTDNNTGSYQWARQIGSPAIDIGYGINVIGTNVNVTGSFEGTADFNPAGTAFNLTSAGLKDIFLSQFDGFTGKHLNSVNMGGAGDEEGLTVCNNPTAVYIGGYFNGTADFDPGIGTFNLISVGVEDLYVAKYGLCSAAVMNTFTTPSVSICAGSTITLTLNGNLNTATGWQLYSGSCGGTLGATNATGIFTVNPSISTNYFVEPTGGCATYSTCLSLSIVTNPTPTLSVVMSTLTICLGQTATLTASGAASYTWSTGSNSPSIAVSPTTTTTYTVKGANGGCKVQTINTLSVTVCAGIYELTNNNNFEIFPNPSSGKITLTGDNSFLDGEIKMYDLAGALVATDKFTVGKKEMNLNLENGIYFVVLFNKEKKLLINKKIIICK